MVCISVGAGSECVVERSCQLNRAEGIGVGYHVTLVGGCGLSCDLSEHYSLFNHIPILNLHPVMHLITLVYHMTY